MSHSLVVFLRLRLLLYNPTKQELADYIAKTLSVVGSMFNNFTQLDTSSQYAHTLDPCILILLNFPPTYVLLLKRAVNQYHQEETPKELINIILKLLGGTWFFAYRADKMICRRQVCIFTREPCDYTLLYHYTQSQSSPKRFQPK
jgi:hypothetical protein